MLADIPQIGGIVRSARESIGLSQLELATKSNISQHTLSVVENNKRFPTYEVFYSIVHSMGISSDTFIYPNRVSCAPELQQFISKFLASDIQVQEFVVEVFHLAQRTLLHDELDRLN